MNRLQQLRMYGTVIPKWLGGRLTNRLRPAGKPVHILFCLVDHYEPGTGNAPCEVEIGRVERLRREYPQLARRHKDADGRMPRRTWFFPPHYHRSGSLRQLVGLCKAGFGEIELHLHHGKSRPDTAENLRQTIECCIEEYSRFGIFGKENGRLRYGFIHGDWALANSRGGHYCGVNNELEILEQTGCYADFTFPSMIESNPSQINSIYYAHSDAARPKSYDRGTEVRRGSASGKGLMIVQGPVYPYFKSGRPTSLRVLGDVIDGSTVVTPPRVDAWVRTGIHVRDKPEWVFVKTHTHGAENGDAVLGPEMEMIFSHLESHYNDGKNFVLHYVSAREMYNVIKAAEAGEPGADPGLYFNYRVSPPEYDESADSTEASARLRTLVGHTYPMNNQNCGNLGEA